MTITLTRAASDNLKRICKESGKYLRFRISSGGCQGFVKEWLLDDLPQDDDIRVAVLDACLLVDAATADLLGDAEIDHVSSISGSGFTVTPSIAAGTCGCGVSFSI